jgi:hypothetical protein
MGPDTMEVSDTFGTGDRSGFHRHKCRHSAFRAAGVKAAQRAIDKALTQKKERLRRPEGER